MGEPKLLDKKFNNLGSFLCNALNNLCKSYIIKNTYYMYDMVLEVECMSLNRRQRRSKVKPIAGLPYDEGRYPSHGELTQEQVSGKEKTEKQGQGQSQAHKIRHMHK